MKHKRWTRDAAVVMFGVVLTLSLLAVDTAMAGEVTKKLKKQIGTMEVVLSELLYDSPFWLVSAGAPTQGAYLDGYGVVVTFEGSLTAGGRWSGNFGKHTVLRGLGGILSWDDEDDWSSDEDDDDADDDKDDAHSWRTHRAKSAERCYASAKDELCELLMDCGDVLGELSDGEWVTIVADLEDHNYFRKQKLSNLILRARMSDVRALDAKQITEEQFRQRINQQEY